MNQIITNHIKESEEQESKSELNTNWNASLRPISLHNTDEKQAVYMRNVYKCMPCDVYMYKLFHVLFVSVQST